VQEKEFFEQVLGLEEPWRVKDIKLDMASSKVEVVVESKPGYSWLSEDGSRLHLHGWEERRWRHLDTMQLETVIVAKVPRLLEPQSGATHMASVPWASKGSRWTVLFEAWAVRLFEAVPTIKRAAQMLRVDWHSAMQIKRRAVERGLQRRQADPIPFLGLDEKSFGRSQDYSCVLSDLAQRRVLDIAPGRTQLAAECLLDGALNSEQKSQVKAVCIDMWQAFENAIDSQLPAASVVYDPFHIVAHANDAVDKVRRAEHKRNQSAKDETLKGSRQLWLYGMENLDPARRERLQELLAAELDTGVAWALKEELRKLWRYHRPSAARAFLERWFEKVHATDLSPLKRVAEMIRSHIVGVLAWFWHQISNGPSEGFNSAIQAIKSLARGFRSHENFRIIVLFHHGKLDLAPR
jgi:transposase